MRLQRKKTKTGESRQVGQRTLNGKNIATARRMSAGKPLRDLTEEALNGYFANLNGHEPARLYGLVLREVEEPLLRSVMAYTRGNQSRAAEVLGINRGTLRKKLKTYGLTDSR
ncbi:MAG: DNA-binding transcriptional regulator Fis [Gammaproteobacteria bacterium]|nr:DNA-binding transcriptional regulator Fis [Gammaproteobacteria bacterium]